LLLRFLAQDSQGNQIVFDLLKSGERVLAIIGDRRVIVGACGGGCRTAAAAIKDRFR
jgi:hypothetical protein